MTRRLDRRQALGAFGTVSLGALLAGCGDERAYFDADKIRSDIRDGHDGARLDLALRVRDASCQPLSNAVDGIFDEALVLDLSREDDGYVGTISFDVAAS